MTVKEYVISKSINIMFSDLNIKGMLLTIKRYDGCIKDAYKDSAPEDMIGAEVEEVLYVKGMDLLTAETYYLLASYVGDTERVTRGTTSISTTKSFGVNDRKDFRDKADAIYQKYGIIDEEPEIALYNSFDTW